MTSKGASLLKLATTGVSARGLSREQAAVYVGVSPGKFDRMVSDGRMPPAKRIDGRRVWDIRQIDRAFDELPTDGNDDAEPDDIWSRPSV